MRAFVALDLAEGFEPGGVRQADVQHDHVRPVPRDGVHGFRGGTRGLNPDVAAAKCSLKCMLDGFFIIHH